MIIILVFQIQQQTVGQHIKTQTYTHNHTHEKALNNLITKYIIIDMNSNNFDIIIINKFHCRYILVLKQIN